MKLSHVLLGTFFLASSVIGFAQSPAVSAPAGNYEGSATVRGQQVPVHLRLTGAGDKLSAALVNGNEQAAASTVSFNGGHLVVSFDYFARTLDGTVSGDAFTGTFGLAQAGATRYPVVLTQSHAGPVAPPDSKAATLSGEWEIAVKSSKGESAWQLELSPQPGLIPGGNIKAVIQRIDGDTGSLYGGYDPATQTIRVSHFTAAGPALYEFKPQPDGTLLVSNLLNTAQTSLIARRPADARAAKLALPTDPTQQTALKDPASPFTFSYPDLTGKVISNSDPEFDGKVVLIAIGGSWCPNCHDEAPMLESLYKQFHARGLEVVDLSFEEADQLKDPTRLRAFIARYGITYTVLLAGDPDQLNEKITIANNLNCWPTSFFIGRDGRVREIHAGFAGPANPSAHAALEHSVTALVEQLLAEPAPARNALLSH